MKHYKDEFRALFNETYEYNTYCNKDVSEEYLTLNKKEVDCPICLKIIRMSESDIKI